MRNARQQTPPLAEDEAWRRQRDLAAQFTALGLTQPPDRMCAGVEKVAGGWAVFTGFQDSD